MNCLKKIMILISTLFFAVNVFAKDEIGNWEDGWMLGDVCYVLHAPNYVFLKCNNITMQTDDCLSIDGRKVGDILIENLQLCTDVSKAEFLKRLQQAKFYMFSISELNISH